MVTFRGSQSNAEGFSQVTLGVTGGVTPSVTCGLMDSPLRAEHDE